MRILKNAFLSLLRFKLFTALNIIGLTIVLTVVYILMIPVYNNLTFNKGIKEADRIYILTHDLIKDSKGFFPPGMAQMIAKDNPYVESYSLGGYIEYELFSLSRKNSKSDDILTSLIPLTPETIDMYGYELAAGTWDGIFKNDNYAVSQSFAKKHLISIGDTLHNKYEDRSFVVCGIFKDQQKNSDIGEVAIISNGMKINNLYSTSQWNTLVTPFIVKLRSSANEKEFLDHFMRRLEESGINDPLTQNITRENIHTLIHLTPLSKIHFSKATKDDAIPFRHGDLETILLLLTLTIILFAIAFINYFNLFSAIIPWRIRSINIQKIMGAYTAHLRCELLIESLIIITSSLLFSCIIVHYLSDTGYFRLWAVTGILPVDNVATTLIITSSSLATALIIALYPAWYITSFSPSFALKGKFGATSSGKKLRYTLICTQFIVSFFFVTVGFLAYQQFRSRCNSDWGITFNNIQEYNLQHEIEMNVTAQMVNHLYDDFRKCNLVEDVTFMHVSFANYNGLHKFYLGDRNRDKRDFRFVHVYHNFTAVMGIEILEGRSFNTDDTQGASVAIINESMHKRYNKGIGDEISVHSRGINDKALIVGICRDFYYNDLHAAIEPLVLIHSPSKPLTVSYIKAKENSNFATLNEYIKKTHANFDPSATPIVDANPLQPVLLKNWLSAEQGILQTIIPLSGTAVAVALLGLFGLISFETRQRRKEIAIRRINGALVQDLLILLNKRFIYILIGCFIFTIPLLIYAFEMWQQNFVNKQPLELWPFVTSFILVMLLTVAIVTVGVWKTVTQNPIEVIGNGD